MKPLSLIQAISKADLNAADTITAHLNNSQIIGLERLLNRATRCGLYISLINQDPFKSDSFMPLIFFRFNKILTLFNIK